MRLSGLKARAVIDKMKSVGVLRRRKQGRQGKKKFFPHAYAQPKVICIFAGQIAERK